MNLSKISNTELTIRLEKLVRSERKLTHVILLHILEIESRRIYAELGYDSMFSYLTKFFGYSEGSAYRRLQAARLLKIIPEVAHKLESGTVNLTQLTQVQKCLKMEKEVSRSLELKAKFDSKSNFDLKSNANSGDAHTPKSTANIEDILSKIENKNTFETNQILALEFNQPIQTTQIIKPQKDESVRIEITLTKQQFENLQEAKNLLSHSIPNGNWSDIIDCLAKKFNQSIHGNKDQDSCKDKNIIEMKSTQRFAATKSKRSHISIKVKRRLMNNAAHACEYKDHHTKNKCGSKYQLQVDHIHPVSFGGSDDFNNLQILCRTHNNLKGSNF